MDFAALNWIAIPAAAVLAFLMGWLWYGPLFGKRWQAEVGLSEEDLNGADMPVVFGSAFLLTAFLSFGLAAFRNANGLDGLGESAGFGAGLAITFVAPAMGMNYLFALRSLVQFAIDAGHFVAMFALMGAVQALIG